MTSAPAPERAATVAELQDMAAAPDLTRRERRELRRLIRFQRRVETWEARRAAPPPARRTHRAVITVLMMLATLFVLWLIVSGPPAP